VEISSRYAALRAAAAASYGFDACIVALAGPEQSVVDAAAILFFGKRLAVVVDDGAAHDAVAVPDFAARIPRKDFSEGRFTLEWLTAQPGTLSPRLHDTGATARLPIGFAETDRRRAAQRAKRVAGKARTALATAGLAFAPPLDLIALLEDEVAWAAASDDGFAALLLHLPASGRVPSSDAGAAEQRVAANVALAQSAVRSTDAVGARGVDLLIVLAGANRDGAAIAAARVARAFAGSAPPRKTRRTSRSAAWSLGSAVYPDDGVSSEAILARVTASLQPI
jgi:hypothetical protein